MIYSSPLPTVEIPEVSLPGYVLEGATNRADRIAIVDGPTGRSLTYGALTESVARMAGGLTARGFGRGDVFAILAPNLPEYATAFLGVAAVGGINTTINPTYTAEEIEFQLRDSGARFLLTIPMFMEQAAVAASGAGIEEIFVLGEAAGATPLGELLAVEPVGGFADVDPGDDVVALPYSSGTTGLPKGVMLTHRNLVANLAQGEPAFGMGDDEVAIAVLPFFHIYGMQVLMNGMLRYGGTVVTMPRFDLQEFLSLIQQHGVTRAYVVPPIVLALAKHPLVDDFDLSSLRSVFSGAAPLSAELALEASARVGCEVAQGYGLTETSPVTHATPPGQFKPGSIGVALSNTECRVVGPDGDDLGQGEDGEIWIRGPQVMKGYLNNPEATAATIDEDGWLHTGDIGHVDDDDHWYIVDRLKELIKYKGFQVAPAELEGLLLTHPAVADGAVIPVPDEEAGEVPKAFVVLKPGAEATPEEIMAHVAGHVAHFKQIRYLDIVEEIPKSASGKILRRILKDQEAAGRV
ncbi:MAG: 4-coumarate--CoA ligase family protein [Acidimicrobiia bacterium]|nr:4-coumarate--CoA ligase family protein [Acidimicrobiia bacterium]